MKQTFAIGDIHGGLRALNELLKLLPIQPKDRLVFLGDYVDGWSESAGVIERLMELEQEYDCIFIKGNHDEWCLNWLLTGIVDELWYDSGGGATMQSYSEAGEAMRNKHVAFLQRLQPFFVDETNSLFIHAGFCSMHGPQHDRHPTNWFWDRTLWETALAIDPALDKSSPFFPKRLKHFEQLFIGHTPTINYGISTPIHTANLWNIDTGAAFSGKLTGIDTQSGQYWQTVPVYTYYPGEAGRAK